MEGRMNKVCCIQQTTTIRCMKITVNLLQTVMSNPALTGIATAALIIPAVPRIGGSSHCP